MPFEWIVGNPPWKELKPEKLTEAGKVAWHWMEREREARPVSGNQVAEAFVWRASEILSPDGAGRTSLAGDDTLQVRVDTLSTRVPEAFPTLGGR